MGVAIGVVVPAGIGVTVTMGVVVSSPASFGSFISDKKRGAALIDANLALHKSRSRQKRL